MPVAVSCSCRPLAGRRSVRWQRSTELTELEVRYRPAARVVCLDAARRVLLLHWQDPFDGSWLWEPPGGGIESDETPFEAARRELHEETGLDPAAVVDRSVLVDRDVRWNGFRYVGPEHFFVAHFAEERPAVVRTGLLPDEQVTLHEYAWISDLDSLTDRLQPPRLVAVLAALVPDGPWRASTPGESR